MTSHSGSKEEFFFFSFQTTQPREKKTQAKTSEKSKEKERAKNQAVTNLTPLKKSRPRDLVAQGTSLNISDLKETISNSGILFSFIVVPTNFLPDWLWVV